MEFSNKTYDSLYFDEGESFLKKTFVRAIFSNCLFGNSHLKDRQIAQNITLDNCKIHSCDIRPAILRNIKVTNLIVSDILLFWGTLFDEVVVEGDVGVVRVNTRINSGRLNIKQKEFDSNRMRFYKSVKFALDISKASFSELSIDGIPLNKIKRNLCTQLIVNKNILLDSAYLSAQFPEKKYWTEIIEQNLSNEGEQILLVAPRGKKFKLRLEGLEYLKKNGLAF